MAARDLIIVFENPVTGHMSMRIPTWQSAKLVELEAAQGVGEAADQAFLEYLQGRNMPDGVTSFLVPLADVQALENTSDDFPAFRDAWHVDGSGNLSVNWTEARALHLAAIREARNAELAKLDVTFMRAVEDGDAGAQSTVATEKQTLRDIPATFSLESHSDAAALKAAGPSELPARE